MTGFTYDEIGERLGLGHARVSHLVREANDVIRREHDRAAPELQPRAGRAARLQELERRPPKWLVASIGRPPGLNVRAEAVLAWRRAALAIDDYRRDHGQSLGDEPLGPRPADTRAARAYELAARAASRAREARQTARERGLER